MNPSVKVLAISQPSLHLVSLTVLPPQRVPNRALKASTEHDSPALYSFQPQHSQGYALIGSFLVWRQVPLCS